MSTHALMFATADYFDVEELKHHALHMFESTAHIFYHTDAFAQAIRDVFSNPMPDGEASPRGIIIDILIEFPHLWYLEPVKQALEDMGAVTLAVLKRKHEKQEEKDAQGLIHTWQLRRLGVKDNMLQVNGEIPPRTVPTHTRSTRGGRYQRYR